MSKQRPLALRSDRPIESKDEDRLGRAPFARVIAEQILSSPSRDSYVVALMGPWGSGKTSLLNMVAQEISHRPDDAVVLRFNPWIFSGTEQLVGHFFLELGTQLTELKVDKISSAGSAIKKYASLFGKVAALVPVAGAGIKAAADITAAVADAVSESPSINKQRKVIREALEGMDRQIVVLVDDIDRLRQDEVRELVKLVRLTGDFPNVVYVLAFDRKRVEMALGDDNETGRAYLEKIVQVGFDVPQAVVADVNKLLFDQLNLALEGLEHGYFDSNEWTDIFQFIIQPLIRSPRDVRRYVNALAPTVRILGREVALLDVLALESIRIFLPDVFSRIPTLVEGLNGIHSFQYSPKDPHGDAVKNFIAQSGTEHPGVVQELLRRIFPFSAKYLGGPTYGDSYVKKWRRYRRVAWPEVLRFYLERKLPEGVVETAQVELVVQLLGDRSALEKMLEEIDPLRFENLLARLEAYEDEFPVAAVESAAGALLDQMQRLRIGRVHIFDLGGEMALHRIILRLFRRIEDEADRERMVSSLLPTLRHISAMRSVVEIMSGHKLASEQILAQWRTDVASCVIACDPGKLAQERSLGVLLVEAFEVGGQVGAAAQHLLSDPYLFFRALVTMADVQSSITFGSVVSNQQLRLPWEALESKFGRERIDEWFRAVLVTIDGAILEPHDRAVLELAKRYHEGWRPTDPFGRARSPAGQSVAESPNGTDEDDEETLGDGA